MNKSIKGISPDVLELFYAYDWPGNVREFKNIMESAYNFASTSIITKDDIPKIANRKHSLVSSSNINHDLYNLDSLNEALENFEKNFIIRKSKNASSLSNLADLMNISRQTLNYKIKKYKINLKK